MVSSRKPISKAPLSLRATQHSSSTQHSRPTQASSKATVSCIIPQYFNTKVKVFRFCSDQKFQESTARWTWLPDSFCHSFILRTRQGLRA